MDLDHNPSAGHRVVMHVVPIEDANGMRCGIRQASSSARCTPGSGHRGRPRALRVALLRARMPVPDRMEWSRA